MFMLFLTINLAVVCPCNYGKPTINFVVMMTGYHVICIWTISSIKLTNIVNLLNLSQTSILSKNELMSSFIAAELK